MILCLLAFLLNGRPKPDIDINISYLLLFTIYVLIFPLFAYG